LLGAALFAHASFCAAEPADALSAHPDRALCDATPHVLTLLHCGRGSACQLGAELTQRLAALLRSAGGCSDESALGCLVKSLCHVLGSPVGGSEAKESCFTALCSLLDAASPWTRLRLLRDRLSLDAAPPTPAPVQALLFCLLQRQLQAGWAQPPFAAPCAQLLTAWLRAAAQLVQREGACELDELADAAVGATNALRTMLLRSGGSSDGLREPAALAGLQSDVLSPLCQAAKRCADAAQAASEEDGILGRLLAAQTLQEVLRCTMEAAES
jgi:hypothetical protein